MLDQQQPENISKLECSRISSAVSSSGYQTVRIFARKPNEFQGRAAHRAKRTRGSVEELSHFYSPTRQHYEDMQKGRIDINALFGRVNTQSNIENSTGILKSEKTTDTLASTPPLRLQIKPNSRREDRNTEQRPVESKQIDVSTFVSCGNLPQAEQPQTIEQLQACVSTLQAENKRLLEQISELKQPKQSGKMVSDTQIGLRKEVKVDDSKREKNLHVHANTITSPRNNKYRDLPVNDAGKDLLTKKYAEECERRAKAETNLRSAITKLRALQQQTQFQQSELKRKEEVVAELAQLLRATRWELESEKQKRACLEELSNQLKDGLHKHIQSRKYLEAQVHVLRQKKCSTDTPLGKLSEEERANLLQANQKLRDEATRLRRRHRERSTELFELSPQKDHN